MKRIIALAALAAFPDFADGPVKTVQKGSLYDDSVVVTNVDLSGFQPAGSYIANPAGGTLGFTPNSISVTNNDTMTSVTIENAPSGKPVLRGEHTYTFPNESGEVALRGWATNNLVSKSSVTGIVNDVKREFYDSQLTVNWTFVADGGEFMMVATTNTNQEVVQ